MYPCVMRWLFALLVVLCLSGLAIGQGRMATVQLDGGLILQGRVLQLDVDHLVLQLADGRIENIEARHILSCNFHRAGDDGKAATVPGETPPPAPEQQSAKPSEPVTGNRALVSRRLSALHHRYPWLAPEEPLQWISLVIMLFALAAIGIHAAAKIAGSDLAQFGRAVALAAGVLIAGVLQLAVVSGGPPILAGVALLNLVAWLVLLRAVFDLSLGGAFVALFATLAEGGVLFLLIELVDKIMRSIGGGWVLQ